MPPKRKAPPGSSSAPVSAPHRPLRPAVPHGSPRDGIDRNHSPLISIPKMFEVMLAKALYSNGTFDKWIATDERDSKTNALINEAFRTLLRRESIVYRQQFSCEIEPFKQSFIRRNHDPPIIFRNVVELGAVGATAAMDASGCKTDIPTEKLDLLIAGTSCVDFSNLNNNKDGKTKVNAFDHYDKAFLTGDRESPVGLDLEFRDAVHNQLSSKGLESIGESMTTFLSTLNFIMDRRPRIVILENVQTAPWKSMANFWLPRAGYSAKFAKVNSKNFYVPQDRLRGYLVAMDAEEFGESGSNSKTAMLVRRTMQILSGLEQRTSSSVLDFLLEDDDPSVLQARDEISRYGVHGLPKDTRRADRDKRIDWDFCKLRHLIYSQRWNLDTIRRFSKATLSHGRIISMSPPASSWIEYWEHETPRVIDLFDSMYQQLLARGGCDLNYKVAMYNISQNLDRMPVTMTKYGIAPIITPAGMPTMSYRARPLLGVECLTLQGIPKNHLRLAGESHKELRDLAGNAMTATVVGAVILASLVAAGPELENIHRASQRPWPVTSSTHVELVSRGLKALPDWEFGDFRLDTSSLATYGGCKVCRCPPVGSHNRITFRCRDCGKLACQLCKDNPPHSFERYNYLDAVIDIADLKVNIQQGLPGVFSLKMRGNSAGCHPGCYLCSMKERVREMPYIWAVEMTLWANEYYFSGVKVSVDCSIVEYRSEHTTAQLTLTRDNGANWYIFPTSEALGTSPVGARELRQKPIARGSFDTQPSTVDPEAAVWCVWEPVKHSWLAAVTVKKDHCFVLDHKTIEARTSPPFHLETHVREMIRGVWYAKPLCGTPEDSLYIRRGPGSQKAFLFKDVHPIGHPAGDHFIISKEIQLAETQERRGDEVEVELRNISDMGKHVRLSVSGYWQPIEPMDCFQTLVHNAKERDYLHRATCATVTGSGTGSCCATAPSLLVNLSVHLANIPVSVHARIRWTDRWYDVPATELDEFFRAILFTANALGKGHFFKPELGLFFDPDRGVPVKLCPDCCVEPPHLHWVKGRAQVGPWEDPVQVREYEARVRAMPEPFMARVRLNPDVRHLKDPSEEPRDGPDLFATREYKPVNQPDCFHDLGLQLAVNPRTLASRAAANLAYGFRPRRYSPTILNDVQCSFQVEVGSLLGPNVRFDRFYDSIPTTEDNTGLRHVQPAGDLCIPSFWRNGYRLREDQARSVKWMMARETGPAPYLETESEEQVFEAFNLRIVGRAAYPNDGSAFCCRGGIVAHEIGYGKTVVMIALLELRRDFDGALSMVKRREAAYNFWKSSLSFIHLKATLVVVPDHITAQWRDEFTKFGCSANVLVIARYADLLRKPLSALEEADVIIVATSIFNASAYKASLNLLMEDRPTGGKSDREAEARYRSSLETIRKAVTRYRELPGNLSDAEKESGALDRAKEVLDEMNQNYQELCQKWEWVGGRKDANKRQRQSKNPVVEKTDGETKTKKRKPLWTVTRFLENFSFGRIIVDEFSYNNPGVTLFFTNSLANAKWLLSGTPRCDNLADIVHLGRLLSIHIARPDPCIPTFLDPITLGPRDKPTAPTEEYRNRASHLRSNNFALDRHRLAETFVKHFARQDKVRMDKFDITTKKIELDLPTLSRVAYGGLRHDLAHVKGNIFSFPFALRQALHVTTTCSYAGDVTTGTKAADVLMARLAAVPITASTLQALLGSSEVAVLTLKEEMKTTIDKLLWLCHRASLVSKPVRDHYPRHHNLKTLVGDIFTAMADARDSWNKWPMAPYGGRDAFSQLCKALCPTTHFRYQEGGVEDWTEWRYIDANSFWPDWYDMPDSYIDGLASPEKRDELVELSTDVILLNISHPLGRSFARTGGVAWLESHAKVLGRVMDERLRTNYLSIRQTSITEQARAAAVRDTVPQFSSEQLIKFLKDCMKEKLESFDPKGVTKQDIAKKGKQALQRHCLSRDLRFSDSTSASQLAETILNYVQGYWTKKDFNDRRGRISPRVEFPTPEETFCKRGGTTEAVLEELTLTYNYFLSCREAWIDAFRRLRLYNLLRFIVYCQSHGRVEKHCDACLRRPVCVGDVPGFIVLACGHWLCEDHKNMIHKDGVATFCPAIGCGAHCELSDPTTIKMTEQDVLGCPDVWDAEGQARCSEGGKIPEIVSLVKQTPEDDRVVLFTYLEELAVLVRDKLSQEGVSVLSMVAAGSDAGLADILEDFKGGEAKVLIIDPTAEHAAGSNLTIANHIIFAGPDLERDAFLRKMHYRQAVGRCLREGQTKNVTIYDFVTMGTIDEELYNPRETDNLGDQLRDDA